MFGEDHVAHPPCSSTMDPAMRGKADAPFSFSRPTPHYHQTLSFISIVVYLHVSDVSCLSGFIRVQYLEHTMKDGPNYSFIKCEVASRRQWRFPKCPTKLNTLLCIWLTTHSRYCKEDSFMFNELLLCRFRRLPKYVYTLTIEDKLYRGKRSQRFRISNSRQAHHHLPDWSNFSSVYRKYRIIFLLLHVRAKITAPDQTVQ